MIARTIGGNGRMGPVPNRIGAQPLFGKKLFLENEQQQAGGTRGIARVFRSSSRFALAVVAAALLTTASPVIAIGKPHSSQPHKTETAEKKREPSNQDYSAGVVTVLAVAAFVVITAGSRKDEKPKK